MLNLPALLVDLRGKFVHFVLPLDFLESMASVSLLEDLSLLAVELQFLGNSFVFVLFVFKAVLSADQIVGKVSHLLFEVAIFLLFDVEVIV